MLLWLRSTTPKVTRAEAKGTDSFTSSESSVCRVPAPNTVQETPVFPKQSGCIALGAECFFYEQLVTHCCAHPKGIAYSYTKAADAVHFRVKAKASDTDKHLCSTSSILPSKVAACQEVSIQSSNLAEYMRHSCKRFLQVGHGSIGSGTSSSHSVEPS